MKVTKHVSKNYRDFDELLLERLQDLQEAATYLKAAYTDDDTRILPLALHDVLRAHGGNIPGLKESLISYSPTQKILTTNLVCRAVIECFENNDRDGALEVIDIYLRILQKTLKTSV